MARFRLELFLHWGLSELVRSIVAVCTQETKVLEGAISKSRTGGERRHATAWVPK